MCSKSTAADLPSTYDVSTYIHNAFVKFLDKLKGRIQVIIIYYWHAEPPFIPASKHTMLGQDYRMHLVLLWLQLAGQITQEWLIGLLIVGRGPLGI